MRMNPAAEATRTTARGNRRSEPCYEKTSGQVACFPSGPCSHSYAVHQVLGVPELPWDMLEHVLSLLPPLALLRTLMRARCVCRQWNSLVYELIQRAPVGMEGLEQFNTGYVFKSKFTWDTSMFLGTGVFASPQWVGSIDQWKELRLLQNWEHCVLFLFDQEAKLLYGVYTPTEVGYCLPIPSCQRHTDKGLPVQAKVEQAMQLPRIEVGQFSRDISDDVLENFVGPENFQLGLADLTAIMRAFKLAKAGIILPLGRRRGS